MNGKVISYVDIAFEGDSAGTYQLPGRFNGRFGASEPAPIARHLCCRAQAHKSRRGPHGGWWLSRPAETIAIADVVRAVDGPLVEVRSERPGRQSDDPTAASVSNLWVTVGSGS